MTRLYFAVPGDLETPTGGYFYDRKVMGLLPEFGIEVTHLPLPGGFPFPSEEELAEAEDTLASVPADSVLLIDGLAGGALPEKSFSRISAPIAAMLHHPLGLETGLNEQESQELLSNERAAVKLARHVIVTSTITRDTLKTLSFAPPPPITVAIPGTEPAPRAKGGGDHFEILSIGSVVPRKGHDVLVEALARLPSGGWRCTVIGSLDRDIDFAGRLNERIETLGLGNRVHLMGALKNDSLDDYLAAADIFALPSRYEGYGMAFAGALARGIPVVACAAGAVPDTVPSDAGILVPPDDVDSLADALHGLMNDKALRQRLSDAAWAHAKTLPSWRDTARIIADVVKELHP